MDSNYTYNKNENDFSDYAKSRIIAALITFLNDNGGIDILKDHVRINKIIADKCPEFEKERRILRYAFEAGVGEKAFQLLNEDDSTVQIEYCIIRNYLLDEIYLHEKAVDFVLSTIIGTLCEVRDDIKKRRPLLQNTPLFNLIEDSESAKDNKIKRKTSNPFKENESKDVNKEANDDDNKSFSKKIWYVFIFLKYSDFIDKYFDEQEYVVSEENDSLLTRVAAMNLIIESGIFTLKHSSPRMPLKVKIPDSVTVIGKSAFKGLLSLREIEIPDSVKWIASDAFKGCVNLIEVEIPDSVIVICNSAFEECRSLREIKIPDSVTEIGVCAFSGCESLKEIEIPDSVTEISAYAFEKCGNLRKIKIPDSVTSIGDYAFEGCENLREIKIPDSVTTIGFNAFSGCGSLKEIEIPKSVIRIAKETVFSPRAKSRKKRKKKRS